MIAWLRRPHERPVTLDEDEALSDRLLGLKAVTVAQRLAVFRSILALPDECHRGHTAFSAFDAKRFLKFTRRKVRSQVEWLSI